MAALDVDDGDALLACTASSSGVDVDLAAPPLMIEEASAGGVDDHSAPHDAPLPVCILCWQSAIFTMSMTHVCN